MKLQNSFTCSSTAAAALALVLTSQLAFSQGSLTPPGPPAPSMKTLAQIEPRTAISSLPIWITNSGSYYLTGNMGVWDDNNGITIQADNVTLDLQGFTLDGNWSGTSGIMVWSKNVSIRNGKLQRWMWGVFANLSGNVQVEHVQASQSNGVGFDVGPNSRVTDCLAHDNYLGIVAGNNATVSACLVTDNYDGIVVKNGATVSSCTASANRNTGIQCSDNCAIKDCTANANLRHGIHALGSRNRIDSNHSVSNAYYGVFVPSTNNIIVRNSAWDNKGGGVYEGCIHDFNYHAINTVGHVVCGPTNDLAIGSGWENFANLDRVQ